MGVSQTPKSQIREVGIRPAERFLESLGVPPMTLQQLTSKTTADHPIVAIENAPGAVTKVRVGTSKGSGLFVEVNDQIKES